MLPFDRVQVSNKGFLTMFDDVSGFGAWHRRWVVLEGNTLAFWKYPENEKVKGKTLSFSCEHISPSSYFLEPIGRIDLGACVTDTVSIAPREICSRMNTFMLEPSRTARQDDKESLVIQRKGHITILRHLLSADSREERLVWCDILNKALDNLRAWDTTSRSDHSVWTL